MAGSHTRCNAGGAFTNGSATPEPTPTISRALIPALASIPGPPERYTNKNLQRAIKMALELFIKGQKHGQLHVNSAPCEQPLKAWFFDLYYRNSHFDCYCFCR